MNLHIDIPINKSFRYPFFFRFLFISVILCFTQQVTAASCDDINALAGYGIIGEDSFDYGKNSKINGNSISGSGNTPTPTGSSETVALDFPDIDPSTFPATGGVDLKPPSPPSVDAGSYGTIEYEDKKKTLVFTGGNYYIEKFVLKNSTKVQLAPGNYFIEDADFGNDSVLSISPAGLVNIYIKNSFQAGNESFLNSTGDIGNLVIYLYDSASLQMGNGNKGKSDVNFNGVIYSPYASSSIQFGNNNQITGAILSAGSVQVGNNTEFDYGADVQAGVIEALGCDIANHIRIEHDGSGAISTADLINVKICADATCSSLLALQDNVSITLTSTLSADTSWSVNPVATINGSASTNFTATAANTYSLGVSSFVVGGVAQSAYVFRCYNTTTNLLDDCDFVVGSSGPDHFNINVGGGSANTCNSFNFSVIAEDSSNNPVTDYTGTVAITSSTAHGNFSTVTATNTVIPNPDNDDNGSASYSFDALDAGSVGLNLANEHAETLTITLTDSAVPVTSTSANVVFSDNAFTITDTDAGVAGDDIPVAGRNHSYQVQMIRKDPLTGCGVATGYDGVKNLKMWRTKNADPSPNAPVLDGTTLPDADPGVANGNMTFSSGVANVTLQTSDIGRYTIELADISNTFADITISGTSNEQIVRPFGIGIDFSSLRDADFTDNGLIDDSTGVDLSYADGIAGSVFTQAGEDFNMTVAGVLWNTADDADNNGIPDATAYLGNNLATPSFGAEGETVTINATVFEPTGASTGIFSVDGVGGGLFNNFAAGTGTQNAVMTYSNVGIIDISASLTDTDYLGSGVNITGSAPRVGRFNPHHYTVTSSLVNNACVVGLFTYSRQPFTVDVTLEAQNKTNIRTDGYRGTYATLDVLAELTIENSETTAAFDSEVITITETFDAGTIASTQLELELRWDMPEQIQTITQVNMLDTSDEVTSVLTSPVNLGSTEVRFGRLNMDNVFGSELLTLTMPMYVEYFNGTNYIVNDSDSVSCSLVASTDLVVARSLSGGSSTEVVGAPLLGRMDIDLTLTPAGSGNTGELDITADISGLPWLQYDWDGLPGLDNPSAQATFGIYSGDTRQIYYRQIYQ